MLLVHALVRAKRGQITGALLESKPSILSRCVDLMFLFPSSSLLQTAVLTMASEAPPPDIASTHPLIH